MPRLRQLAAQPDHAPTLAVLSRLDELEADADAELERELELAEPSPSLVEDEADDMLDDLMDELVVEMAAQPSAEESRGPSPELPPGATIAVVGAGTDIGRRLLDAIDGGSSGWVGAAVEAGPAAAGALSTALAGAAAVVVVSASAGGPGGVAPAEMEALMAAMPDGVTRLVMLSTHGVERTGSLPWSLANVFGQLDTLRAAEQEVQLRASKRVPSYSVLRVGKVGAAGEARCELAPGDALQGDVAASAVGSVLLQALSRPAAVNASFSAGPLAAGGGGAGASASDEAFWEDQFLKLDGPEIFRRPIDATADELVTWLRAWAQGFTKEGAGLTTPVRVDDADGGAIIRFVKKVGAGYADFDAEETADEKWAAAAASKAPAKPEGDGALLITAEGTPGHVDGDGTAPSRVRVARAEMVTPTGGRLLVKEMSEASVLSKLEKDLAALEKARRR